MCRYADIGWNYSSCANQLAQLLSRSVCSRQPVKVPVRLDQRMQHQYVSWLACSTSVIAKYLSTFCICVSWQTNEQAATIATSKMALEVQHTLLLMGPGHRAPHLVNVPCYQLQCTGMQVLAWCISRTTSACKSIYICAGVRTTCVYAYIHTCSMQLVRGGLAKYCKIYKSSISTN